MDNPALPTGGIPMTPITPFAGLFRWCIMSSLRVSIELPDQEEQQKCYSKIQQLLMDSMLHLKMNTGNKNAISAQHFSDTTRALISFLNPNNKISIASKELALERLAQTSSAMSTSCIYGNKREYKI